MKSEKLEDYIDDDKKRRDELDAMLKKAQEFLEAHGYEVFEEGTLEAEKDRTRDWMLSSARKSGNGVWLI